MKTSTTHMDTNLGPAAAEVEREEVNKLTVLEKAAIIEEEQLLDVARCVLNGIRVETAYVKALCDWLKDRVFENREVVKLWQKRLETDPDTDIYAWIADTTQPAREFMRQLVIALEKAGVEFVVTPARGDTSHAYYFALTGKLQTSADIRLMKAAAQILGCKGLGFSIETARKLLQESARVVSEEDFDPSGLLLQADGTVLDLREARVYERVDGCYFKNSLNTAVTVKDIEVIKSLIERYSWEEAENLVLQNYAPTFARVIDNVFRSEKERAQFRECVGSIFFPGVLRTAFIIVGEAGIGKSVIADAMLYALGDYAASKPWAVLLSEEGEKHIGGLKGKYANIVSESPRYMIKNVELFKRLTGDEWLEGRLLYRNLFRFRNVCKHIMMCNKVPVFSEIDRSVAERLYIIEASGEPPVEPDPELREKTREEAKGVLMWMLTNHIYFRQGRYRLKYKPELEYIERLMVVARSNVYAFVEDLFGGGVAGYIAEIVKGSRVKGTQLRELYVQWCNERGEPALGTIKFYEDFAAATQDRGVTRSYGSEGAVIFLNLRLVPIVKTESHLLDL